MAVARQRDNLIAKLPSLLGVTEGRGLSMSHGVLMEFKSDNTCLACALMSTSKLSRTVM